MPCSPGSFNFLLVNFILSHLFLLILIFLSLLLFQSSQCCIYLWILDECLNGWSSLRDVATNSKIVLSSLSQIGWLKLLVIYCLQCGNWFPKKGHRGIWKSGLFTQQGLSTPLVALLFRKHLTVGNSYKIMAHSLCSMLI